jgi:DNA-binding transcriptional regulator YhcF (GntR family)
MIPSNIDAETFFMYHNTDKNAERYYRELEQQHAVELAELQEKYKALEKSHDDEETQNCHAKDLISQINESLYYGVKDGKTRDQIIEMITSEIEQSKFKGW